jgi:hypothetical protein
MKRLAVALIGIGLATATVAQATSVQQAAQQAALKQAQGAAQKYNSTHTGSSFSDVYAVCASQYKGGWWCADSWRLTVSTGPDAGHNIVCGFPVVVVFLGVGSLSVTHQEAATSCTDFTGTPPTSNPKQQLTLSQDAAAKELAHSGQVAAETYATDNSGSYVGLTPAVLHQYEPTIQIGPGKNSAYIATPGGVSGSAKGYRITATSASGHTFSITRNGGSTNRTCTPSTGTNGGCVNGTW